MKKLLVVIVILVALAVGYHYCVVQERGVEAATDYDCFNDCLQRYSYGYCRKFCEY